MARTMTVNKGGGTDYGEGWKTATISRAAYGVYNDSKYIDVWFEGYPDNFNARIYANISNGEEWSMGQVFRFANAGITGGLEGDNGKMVIKMDDNPALLAGKQVNIYLYKDGKYSKILKQFAPTEFKNVAEEFTSDDVIFWKGKADKYYEGFVKPKVIAKNQGEGVVDSSFVSSTTTNETSTASTDEIPF